MERIVIKIPGVCKGKWPVNTPHRENYHTGTEIEDRGYY
jgi:hypothetical protein